MADDNYFDLIAELASADRTHNSDGMAAAVKRLASHYSNSKIIETPSGTELSNHWRIPPRYVLHDAYIKANGAVILDKSDHALAVNAFSHPVSRKISFDCLKAVIVSDPNRPDDYIFSFRNQYRFWETNWGFSMPHNRFLELDVNAEYEVFIDSEFHFGDGNEMLQVEYLKKGKEDQEIILVGHFDHPGQVNDGLAGTIAAFEVVDRLQKLETKFSYRALASVEIVGSAAYLEQRKDAANIVEGIFVGFSGNDAPVRYQTSFHKKSGLDRIIAYLLRLSGGDHEKVFGHRQLIGNDENVFDSVGYDIPMGTILRYPFPEYHTGSDSIDITSKDRIESIIQLLMDAIFINENNKRIKAKYKGLPCLSNPSVDLYLSFDNVSGFLNSASQQNSGTVGRLSLEPMDIQFINANPNALNGLMQTILREADGQTTILDVAEKLGLPFRIVRNYATLLSEKNIMKLLDL